MIVQKHAYSTQVTVRGRLAHLIESGDRHAYLTVEGVMEARDDYSGS